MMNTVYAADLFCGAGGTTTGLLQACAALGLKVDLTAINHWLIAIETHAANHPSVRHICETLDSVDPRKVTGGKLDVLLASPECTHHSNARGGKPRSDQSRASAWHVLRWAEALTPGAIIIENVREWRSWGPLDNDGMPVKSRKGETYRAFLAALASLGYYVEEHVLNAADYGDPTTRRRLFVMATRGPMPPIWPSHTHAEVSNGLPQWKPARDIIDWNLPGKSIFNRKKPLAPKTIARIAAGIKKFWGPWAEPFLVMLYGTGTVRSLDRPLPTITAGGGRGGGHIGLAQPFLVNMKGQSTAMTVSKPLPTQTGSYHMYLAEPFLVPQFGERPTQDPRTHSIDSPLPAVTSHGAGAVCSPFLVKYYRTGGAKSIEEPLDTITSKDTFGLVEPDQLDIRFRMLQPHELAAGMSFPDGYHFSGNKGDQVKQIGNAVPVQTARALCTAAIQQL